MLSEEEIVTGTSLLWKKREFLEFFSHVGGVSHNHSSPQIYLCSQFQWILVSVETNADATVVHIPLDKKKKFGFFFWISNSIICKVFFTKPM